MSHERVAWTMLAALLIGVTIGSIAAARAEHIDATVAFGMLLIPGIVGMWIIGWMLLGRASDAE